MAFQLINTGHQTWSMTRNKDGQRTYKIKYRVKGLPTDGPTSALATPGLPQPGDVWEIDNDRDLWAFCGFDTKITPILSDEPNKFFDLEFTYSTENPERCQDNKVEDPLQEPMKISFSFTKYQEEATQDRFGNAITNSSYEPVRGPQVEFDKSRMVVKIQQNVLDLNLPLLASMNDTLNDAPLWGFPRRCIKVTIGGAERKFFGQCSVYFTRSLEFECRWDGFDRNIPDEGTKVLNGHWGNPAVRSTEHTHGWILDPLPLGGIASIDPGGLNPDPDNPSHYTQFKDRNGENTHVMLNGNGRPYDPNGISECFYGSRTDAEERREAIGATDIDGPFDTETDCMGLQPQQISGLPGYWCIRIEYLIPPAHTFNLPCFYGTAEDASDQIAALYVSEGEFVRITKDGPYTTLLRCQDACEDNIVTGWWHLGATNLPGRILLEKYDESNFLLLGIPTDLTDTGATLPQGNAPQQIGLPFP